MRVAVNNAFWRTYFTFYDRLSRSIPYQRLIKDSVNRLGVVPGGTYLDLGSGTGNVTKAIAEAAGPGGRVIGIDSSKVALEMARSKAREAGLSNLEFIFGNIDSRLNYANESFDGVMANNVMYLVKDPAATMAEIMRVLKPGCNFVMTNPRQGAKPTEIFMDHLRQKRAEYVGAYGRHLAKPLIAAHAGLRLLDFISLLPFQMILKNSGVIEARFWSSEQWQVVFSALHGALSIQIEFSPPFSAYSGQNNTFVLSRR